MPLATQHQDEGQRSFEQAPATSAANVDAVTPTSSGPSTGATRGTVMGVGRHGQLPRAQVAAASHGTVNLQGVS